MYLSKWINEDKFIKKIFNLLSHKVETVTFVDSFGALMPQDIINFFKKIKKYYPKNFKNNSNFKQSYA